MFKIIDNAIVVSFRKGFYQEHRVFSYKDNLYMQWGKKFVALQKRGCAVTGVSIDEILLPFKYEINALGYLTAPKNLKGKA